MRAWEKVKKKLLRRLEVLKQRNAHSIINYTSIVVKLFLSKAAY